MSLGQRLTCKSPVAVCSQILWNSSGCGWRSGALALPPSGAFGSLMYLNMSFNSALGGAVPASLSTAGIFNMQARRTGHIQTTEGCMWEPLHSTTAIEQLPDRHHIMRFHTKLQQLA